MSAEAVDIVVDQDGYVLSLETNSDTGYWWFWDDNTPRLSTTYPTRQAAMDAWTNRSITWEI